MADTLFYDNEAFEEENEKAGVNLSSASSATEEPTHKDALPIKETATLNQGPSRGKGSVSSLFNAIRSGNIDNVNMILDQNKEFIHEYSYGGLTPLHAACHAKRVDILLLLIGRGANVNSYDKHGNSILHFVIREKWHAGLRELLQHGASPNGMTLSTKSGSGKVKEIPLHTAVRLGDKESTSILLQYYPDLSLTDSHSQSVFQLAACQKHLYILRELLAEEKAIDYLYDLEKKETSLYHTALSGTGGAHNEQRILKVFRCIYEFYGNLEITDSNGETPLILACRAGLPSVVQFLLNNGANPKHITKEGQSAIHVACSSGCFESLKLLIKTDNVGELIRSKDINGYHPFYFAVESTSTECCKLLIENEDHLLYTYKDGKTNFDLVMNKLPNAMKLLKELLNSKVKISDDAKDEPNFSISFDFSVFLSPENKRMQTSLISELAGSSLESLIKHPLIESFLHLKWSLIRRKFYMNVAVYFIYLLMHTTFVMLTFGTDPMDWSKHKGSLITIQVFHTLFIIFLGVYNIIITFANFRKYMIQGETYIRFGVLVCSAAVIFLVSGKVSDDITNMNNKTCNNETAIQMSTCEKAKLTPERTLASMSMVFGWVHFMFLLGRFPGVGAYILMFNKVGKTLIKFLLAFLSLLIGFSLGFHILFQRLPIFHNYQVSFAKTLTMMTGGVIYSEFINQEGSPLNEYCMIYLSTFLLTTSVIMSNLLIGLAVTNLSELKKKGKIKKSVKRLSFLTALETILDFTYKMRKFPGALRSLLRAHLIIKPNLTIFPNKEFMRHKYRQTLPKNIIKDAIEVACYEESDHLPMDMEEEEDVSDQVKSLKLRYMNDIKAQTFKFDDIGQLCLTIKKEMDQLKSKSENQLNQLTSQLQEQRDQNQRLLDIISQKEPI